MYKKELTERGLTDKYIRRIELVLKRCCKELKKGKQTTHPTKITYDDLLFMRDKTPVSKRPNGSTRKQQYHIDILRGFLRSCGNYIRSPPFQKYIPDRPRITPNEYDELIKQTEFEDELDIRTARVMILLGCLTIGRIGQLRLRPEDIQTDRITVLGKGRDGGKPRVILIPPEIFNELREYMQLRTATIQECLKLRSNQEIPDKLLIWRRTDNRIGSVKRSKFDELMKNISNKTGIKTTAHQLRRYGGTEIYRVTKDKEVTMKIGGWSDDKTFRDYLGLDPDLEDAIKKVVQLRQARQNGTKTYHLP